MSVAWRSKDRFSGSSSASLKSFASVRPFLLSSPHRVAWGSRRLSGKPAHPQNESARYNLAHPFSHDRSFIPCFLAW